MSREWKPGDVAICQAAHGPRGDGEYVMARAHRGWSTVGDPDYYWSDTLPNAAVTPIRPLLLIDPEDREQVERLTQRYLDQFGGIPAGHRTTAMQAALRSLIEPPKPDEPGTFGVVAASCYHSTERRKWIRHEDGNWWPMETYNAAVARIEGGRDPRLPDCWDDLVDPEVVREGVTA